MLSRKRQIMFEVLGHRHANVRVTEPARPVRARTRGGDSRRTKSPPARAAAPGAARPHMWLLAVAGVVALATGLVAYRASGGGEAPMLQRNLETAAPPPAQPAVPDEAYAVCAMSLDYGTRTERRRAEEKARDAVEFLWQHSDPDFRDVRGYDHPGKEPGSGTFRVYVGSARSRSELVALKNKLMAIVWNRHRPFQRATVKLVDGDVAFPGAKEQPR